MTLFLIFSRGIGELRKLKFWLIVIASGASFLILFVIVSVEYFSFTGACANCHEMAPEIKTWKISKHSHVPCLGCHLEAQNTIEFIIEKPQALREVYNHFTGNYPKIINSNSKLSQKIMTSRVCLRCHLAKRKSSIFGKGIKINHNAHVDLKITCETCHNRIAHRGARGFNYLDGLRMMDGCMRCHLPGKAKRIKGKVAPTGCPVCHIEKDIGQKAFNKSNPTFLDFSDCQGCHKITEPVIIKEFSQSKLFTRDGLICQSCHGDHLKKDFVAQPDPQKCLKCHKGVSNKVIDNKHGSKIKTPFKKPSDVRCEFCHPSHAFSIPKSK